MTTEEEARAKVLVSYGAGAMVVRELLAYNKNLFNHKLIKPPIRLPLADEPFVSTWRKYASEAKEKGVFESLEARLVQLRFPIKRGMSRTRAYRTATREGAPTEGMPEATGLVLRRPDGLRLVLHRSPAGRIPLLIAGDREDFVSLVRALALRSEPKRVPPSEGACTVTGFDNWDRIRAIRAEHRGGNPSGASEDGWRLLFQWTIAPHKELYQDRFVLLSDGPYSGVSAEEMGLPGEKWRRLSLVIRREHECMHYLTERLFASMQNRLLDEIIADYMGIVCAAGRYRADWFLRFMGLESFPKYRRGGRLENYKGEPSLSRAAFAILQALVKDAAENLEELDRRHPEKRFKLRIALTLTYSTLEQLASKGAVGLLEKRLDNLPLG